MCLIFNKIELQFRGFSKLPEWQTLSKSHKIRLIRRSWWVYFFKSSL